MPPDDLLPNEIALLAHALDGPMLAFAPLVDEMIADLLDRQMLAIPPDADPRHALLELTEAGRRAVLRQLR